MNVVLDDAEEVWVKDTKSKKLGTRNHLGTPTPPLSLPPCRFSLSPTAAQSAGPPPIG